MKAANRTLLLILTVVIFITFITGCSQTKTTAVVFAMDTVCDITVYENAENFDSTVYSLISEAEETVTFSDGKSIKAEYDGLIFEISPVINEILTLCLKIYTLSDGKYDPTVLPLTELWNVVYAEKPPLQEEIADCLSLVGFDGVMLSDDSVVIAKEGAGIDIGSAGKGMAGDLLAEKLVDDGFLSGIINLGGNVRVFGDNPYKENGIFAVGIKDPNDTQTLYASVEVKNMNVVTSGSYERYFIYDGVKYHHIIDPFTGYPSDNGVASVTVISENGLLADILSTAVFVCGKDDGMELVKTVSDEYPDIAAMIIMTDGSCETFNMETYGLKLLK